MFQLALRRYWPVGLVVVMGLVATLGLLLIESTPGRARSLALDIFADVGAYGVTLVVGLGLTLLLALYLIEALRRNRRLQSRNAALHDENRYERQFRALFENAPNAIIIYDAAAERLLDANRQAEALFALRRDKLLRVGLLDFYLPEQPDGRPPRESFAEHVKRTLGGEDCLFERLLRAADGQVRHCEVWLSRLPSTQGGQLLWASFVDITGRRASEDRLQFANVLLTTEMESAPDGILVVNESSRIILVNRRFGEMFDISPSLLTAGNDEPVLALATARMKDPDKFLRRVRYFYDHPEESGRDELETIDDRFIDRNTAPLRTNDGRYLGRVWFFRDITDRRTNEQRIVYEAYHDALTGLFNRRAFVDSITQAIARTRRGGKAFAVLYLDLDHFKDINDTLGHPAGDELLKLVAARLQKSLRATDMVSRFGGDEFAVLQSDIDNPADIAILAQKLLAVVSEPAILGGDNSVHTGTSIGVAVYGPEAPDAETMMSHADLALYRAKAEGRHTYRFFTEAMDEEVHARVTLGEQLGLAIASDQLFIAYQPQVDDETGRILGAEGLVRWHHPKRGVLMPDAFIAIAEASGLIIELGEWTLNAVCRQAKSWLDAGIAIPSISVNVSPQQFKAPTALKKSVERILAETGLPPSVLELELTETALMEAGQSRENVLVDLRGKGIRVAIDDFGTGYSSLAYLIRYPVDRIKIAQEFMRNVTSDPASGIIVRAAINIAHDLGLKAIAEGVQTREQLELLKSWNCRQVQGYYYAKPLSAEAMAALLRQGTIVPADASEAAAREQAGR